MKGTAPTLAAAAAAVAWLAGLASAAANCSGTFVPMTAREYVDASNAGWNLGNTLDAIPDEGSWNNPRVVAATFDAIAAAGFRSVRIPVTYTHHFLTEAPDYTVDPAWLQRVSDVVDMALERGLLVVTNVHHDSWEWADVSAAGADVPAIMDKFAALWAQIADRLACKPSALAFEPINEPPANTAADGANVNTFNDVFLEALAASGGFNPRRVVTLVGGNMDAGKTSQWFEVPFAGDFSNPWALQFHYYSPYDFTFSAWGRTIWGSDADKAAVDAELGLVAGNFTDVPLYIGEFDASPVNTEEAARWKWFDYVVRAAGDVGAALIVWDNGADHLDRASGEWRDPTVIDVMLEAADGVVNSLPDSTVDGAAAEQSSSAYIFNRAGDAPADAELPWLFNGNTLEAVSEAGAELALGSDYAVSAGAVTFSAAYLATLVSADSAPGIYANLTLSFSAGADVIVQVVQWDVPTLAADGSVAVPGSALSIPVEWAGLEKLATVKMVADDGTYITDDWTQYLGPLQQARGTHEGQWKWEGDYLIIQPSIVDAVVALGQPATLTFEFYPRVPENVVEYTLTP